MFDIEFMKAIQEKLGLSSVEMANILGMKVNTYNGRMVNGTSFSISDIIKIINFYGGGSKIEFCSYFEGKLSIHIMIFPLAPLDVEDADKWRFANRINLHFSYENNSQ